MKFVQTYGLGLGIDRKGLGVELSYVYSMNANA